MERHSFDVPSSERLHPIILADPSQPSYPSFSSASTMRRHAPHLHLHRHHRDKRAGSAPALHATSSNVGDGKGQKGTGLKVARTSAESTRNNPATAGQGPVQPSRDGDTSSTTWRSWMMKDGKVNESELTKLKEQRRAREE